VKIATLNLRATANDWEARFPLVVDALAQTDADVIAVQEVRINVAQHKQLAQALTHGAPYTPYLCEDWYEPHILANAILSRLPIIEHERVELPQFFRTAQRIMLEIAGQKINIANTHLHHKPYRNEVIRLEQMRFLLDWLNECQTPYILMGDMNATPASETVQFAKRKLKSAYEVLHGTEPTVTFPTPLRSGENITPRTIDYIFCTPELRVQAAHRMADTPHPENPLLYPSDHFGLYSEIITP
jgi:endonuclease/exonuclease/phosphatase family metal-dependent hydrolase